MKKLVKDLLFKLFSLLPVNKNVITFESYCGKKINDSPKAIYDKMKAQNLNYKYIWFVIKSTNTEVIPKNEVVYKSTLKWFYYTAISKIWIKNTGEYGGLKKRQSQVYIQTWHGNCFKKWGKDVDPNNINEGPKDWDYTLSTSPFYSKCLSSATGVDLKFLDFGYPRVDYFFKDHSGLIKDLKTKLNIPDNKKTILYAPTFRDIEAKGVTEVNTQAIAEIPSDYLVLYRAHPHRKLISTNLPNVIDVSDYNEINDLMLISDALITDYSSVFHDYLILKKPVIFYAYDLENYRDHERGFYFDYKTLPGRVTQTPDELHAAINDLPNYWQEYKTQHEYFIKTYNPYEDGNSSKRLVNWLKEKLEGEQ